MAMRLRRYLHNDVSQAGVAQQQPAARRDTVGFVLELLGVQFVEVFEPAERKRSEPPDHAGQEGADPLPRSLGRRTHTLFFTMSE